MLYTVLSHFMTCWNLIENKIKQIFDLMCDECELTLTNGHIAFLQYTGNIIKLLSVRNAVKTHLIA